MGQKKIEQHTFWDGYNAFKTDIYLTEFPAITVLNSKSDVTLSGIRRLQHDHTIL